MMKALNPIALCRATKLLEKINNNQYADLSPLDLNTSIRKHKNNI